MSTKFVCSNQDVQVLPEIFTKAVRDIIVACNRNKIAAIKLLRDLQYQPTYWTRKPDEHCVNHIIGLLDAKNIVEEVARNYGIEFAGYYNREIK